MTGKKIYELKEVKNSLETTLAIPFRKLTSIDQVKNVFIGVDSSNVILLGRCIDTVTLTPQVYFMVRMKDEGLPMFFIADLSILSDADVKLL